jgi:hypothetical protein
MGSFYNATLIINLKFFIFLHYLWNKKFSIAKIPLGVRIFIKTRTFVLITSKNNARILASKQIKSLKNCIFGRN